MRTLLALCLLGLTAGPGETTLPTNEGTERATLPQQGPSGETTLPADEGTERATLPQQGCCSWHGGVCGCRYGRVVCCDGTLSPSCHC